MERGKGDRKEVFSVFESYRYRLYGFKIFFNVKEIILLVKVYKFV